MRVFLLRHADAAPGHPDESRRLTDHGIAQMQTLAKTLPPQLFSGIQSVWHSPYERARHTAQLACELFKITQPLIPCRDMEPATEIEFLAKKLLNTPSDALLVGHNPSMELLASYLLT
ncbi:MAG TPA: histidine phosphatase family protein, partial [Opitutales bacterium]|nr:histidine phosphatase family protein [Opitutales bacterium]